MNIAMPQMGESIFEGTITKWLKKEGDLVKRDEPLFEISTDKVDTEIPSPVAGVLQKIIVPVGSKIPIHTVVAIVEESGAPPQAPKAAPAAPAAAPKPSPPPPPPPVPVSAVPATAAVSAGAEGDRRVFSSPLVRRMARQEGVDLGAIPGSGWKGRITKKDLLDHLGRQGTAEMEAPPAPVLSPGPAPAPAAPILPAPAVPSAPGARSRVVPMTPMRSKIAEHMVVSRRTSAHVTTVFEVDMSRVVELREREKDDYEKVYGTRLTFTHFFAMAAVQTLKDFPVFNSSVDGPNIVYKSEINLGVAVALPEGLIVPVVRNCEEKSFLGLVRGVNDVAERARSKKLALSDIQGGTFTLTNPGSFGGLFATPIINQPQVAILGVGTIEKRPVVIHDAIAIRSMCYLDLSFDHRVIDGLDAEKFMARVKELLQTWTIPIR
jgi:2-oxoglutarate dehydrogenase E2 component (dihydrolipoamide succinyltransferase)